MEFGNEFEISFVDGKTKKVLDKRKAYVDDDAKIRDVDTDEILCYIKEERLEEHNYNGYMNNIKKQIDNLPYENTYCTSNSLIPFSLFRYGKGINSKCIDNLKGNKIIMSSNIFVEIINYQNLPSESRFPDELELINKFIPEKYKEVAINSLYKKYSFVNPNNMTITINNIEFNIMLDHTSLSRNIYFVDTKIDRLNFAIIDASKKYIE